MPLPHFDSILSSRPDPLGVLNTTAPIVRQARYVTLDLRAIQRAANALAAKSVDPPPWNYEYHFFDGAARTVAYLFLLDALNFCFWGAPRWTISYKRERLDGYWALAASLKQSAERDPRVLDAGYWSSISPQDLADILRGDGSIPLFPERWRNVRELGAVLRDHWGGNPARLVESAQGDAARLARTIADSFSSFNDVAVYQRKAPFAPVNFFKRAQILVADIWGAFQGKQWGEFRNMDALTAFADYKLPQILRAWGILKYASPLARRVDSQIEIAAGSAQEIEIRAATLWAVEFLRQALAARGRAFKSIQIDWILWEASQGRLRGIKPYHRVRTIFY